MLIDYKKLLLIDHRSTVKIVDQLYNQFEELLSSSKVVNKQVLLCSNELASILNLDEIDVFDVYQRLEKNNFIEISKNKTVRVSKYNRILDFFNRLILIEDGIRAIGKTPSEELLVYEVVKANKNNVSEIDRYQDKRFLKQVRLIKADDEPYIYLEEFYPIERFPKLIDVNKPSNGRVFQNILKEAYHLQFKKNLRDIKVQLLDQKMAKLLNVRKGLPAFKINMICYDQKELPFVYTNAVSLPYFYFDYNIKIK